MSVIPSAQAPPGTVAEAGRLTHDAVVEIDEAAFKGSVSEPVDTLSQYVVAAIGGAATATGLGLSDTRPLARYQLGEAPRERLTEQRLRVLFRVVYAVSKCYSDPIASAFVRSANPNLDDRSVLLVLREAGTVEELAERETEIVRATRMFLEA